MAGFHFPWTLGFFLTDDRCHGVIPGIFETLCAFGHRKTSGGAHLLESDNTSRIGLSFLFAGFSLIMLWRTD